MLVPVVYLIRNNARFLARLLCLSMCFLFVLTPNAFSKGISEYDQSYFAAENTTDVLSRIEKWQGILSKYNVGSGVSAHNIKKLKLNLVADYVLQAHKEAVDINIVSYLEKAFEQSNSLVDANEKIWAKIYIVSKSVDFLPKPNLYSFLYNNTKDLEADIQTLKTQELRDYAYAGMIDVYMRPVSVKKWRKIGAINSDKLVRQIQSPKHRARSMFKIAEYKVKSKAKLDPISRELYQLIVSDKTEIADLVSFNEKAMQKDQFLIALDALTYIDHKKKRPKHLYDFFESMMKAQEYSRAKTIINTLVNPSKSIKAWSALSRHYYKNGYTKQAIDAENKAISAASKLKTQEKRDKALDLIKKRVTEGQKKTSLNDSEVKLRDHLLTLVKQNKIEDALNEVRAIKNSQDRVKLFRFVAESQAKHIDQYNILSDVKDPQTKGKTYFHKDFKGSKTINASHDNDIKIGKKDVGRSKIVLRRADDSHIGQILPHFIPSDALSYNTAYVNKAIPALTRAKVQRVYYENLLYNFKFYSVAGNAGFVEMQDVIDPEIIFIENGVTDIPAIYDNLRDQGIFDYITKQGNTYLLRRPLVIGNDATLVVTSDSVAELKISQEKGAYIASVGTIFISGVKITGWNEKKQQPSWANYKQKNEFRPFLTFWSRSKSYIANSELTALGYVRSKSYGLSFSAGPNAWLKKGNENINRPTGIVTDNSFNNMFFGFYSYEADKVSMIGNEYINNIVYGIDPHDRSRELNIAYNTAYGTEIKHGIIISREVTDTAIIGNITFDNKGSGFMVDRMSEGTTVYANTALKNKQDGITFFESDCAIISSNLMLSNERSGIRVRNGRDIGVFFNEIKNNKHAGLYGYIADLKNDPLHQHRDFALDPYHNITEISAVGNHIEQNLYGISMDNISGLLMKENKFKKQSPKILKGNWFKNAPDALFRFNDEKQGSVMFSLCSNLIKPDHEKKCKFREYAYFKGDVMDYSARHLPKNICSDLNLDKGQH